MLASLSASVLIDDTLLGSLWFPLLSFKSVMYGYTLIDAELHVLGSTRKLSMMIP